MGTSFASRDRVEMFKPNLNLTRESDGTYTVTSVTLVPTGGYIALPATLDVPLNVRLADEVLSVALRVTARKGSALPFVTTVKHRLARQALGGTLGKTGIVAFVILDDVILGSATASVLDALPAQDAPSLETSDWYAWRGEVDGRGSLHVLGTVTVPDPGYECELRLAVVPSSDPSELVLELRTTRRPGRWPRRVTALCVRFEEVPRTTECKSVVVRGAGAEPPVIDVENA